MKKILLYLVTFSPAGVWAQQKAFTMEGTLKNSVVNGKYVYLAYNGKEGNKLDSAEIVANKYSFKGELSQPGNAMLFNTSPMTMAGRNPKNRVSLYLVPENFSITHVDSFTNVSFKGSVANTEYAKLWQQMTPLITKSQQLAGEYRTASNQGDTARVEQLKKELDTLNNAMKNDIFLAYVKNNPSSPIALFALQSAVGSDIDPDFAGPLFDKLSAANRESEAGIAFHKTIEAAKNTSIGHAAPEFTQNDTLGNPISLASFRGSYVLVDFWASWCGPCRMENPHVVSAYHRFKGKGFKILSVSLDRPNDKTKWMDAIHKDGLAWTHVSDLQFWNNAVAKAYGINSIPQNFLLDPQGKIIAKGLRGDELVQQLEKIYP